MGIRDIAVIKEIAACNEMIKQLQEAKRKLPQSKLSEERKRYYHTLLSDLERFTRSGMLLLLIMLLGVAGLLVTLTLAFISGPGMPFYSAAVISLLASWSFSVMANAWRRSVESYVAGRPHNPPRLAQIALCFILRRQDQDAIMADLDEMFQKRVTQFGPRVAWCWYWGETLRSIGPLVWSALTKLLKWGFGTILVKIVWWVIEMVRRWKP